MTIFWTPQQNSTPYAVPKPASALPSWFTKKKLYIWSTNRNPESQNQANLKWFAPATLLKVETLPATQATTSSVLTTDFFDNITTKSKVTRFRDEDIYFRQYPKYDDDVWRPTWNDTNSEEPGRIFLHFLAMKGDCQFDSTLKEFLLCEVPVTCRHCLWFILLLILLFAARLRMNFIKGPVTMRSWMRVCVFFCASMMGLAMIAQIQMHREMLREMPVIRIYPADNGEISWYMDRISDNIKRISTLIVNPYKRRNASVSAIARNVYHFTEKLLLANEEIATSYLSPKETFHINSPFMNVFLKYEWIHFMVFMTYWPLVMLIVSLSAVKKKFLVLKLSSYQISSKSVQQTKQEKVATIVGAVFLCAAAVAITSQALLFTDCCDQPERFTNGVAKQHKILSEQTHFQNEYNRACSAWFARFEIKLEYFEKQYLYASKELRRIARQSSDASNLFVSDFADHVYAITLTVVPKIRQSLPPRCTFHFSRKEPTRVKKDLKLNHTTPTLGPNLPTTSEDAPITSKLTLSASKTPFSEKGSLPSKGVVRSDEDTYLRSKIRLGQLPAQSYGRDMFGPIYMPPADAVMRTLCRRDRKLFWMLAQIIIMLTAAALIIMTVLLGLFTLHSQVKPPNYEPKIPCFYELSSVGFHSDQNQKRHKKKSSHSDRKCTKRFRTKKPHLLRLRHKSPKNYMKSYGTKAFLRRTKTIEMICKTNSMSVFMPYGKSLRNKRVLSSNCSNFDIDTHLKKKNTHIKQKELQSQNTIREIFSNKTRKSFCKPIIQKYKFQGRSENSIKQTNECSLQSVHSEREGNTCSVSYYNLSDISIKTLSTEKRRKIFKHDKRLPINDLPKKRKVEETNYLSHLFGIKKNAVLYEMWPPPLHVSKKCYQPSIKKSRYKNEGLSKYPLYLGNKRKSVTRKAMRKRLPHLFKSSQKSMRKQKDLPKSFSMCNHSMHYDETSGSLTVSYNSNMSVQTLESQRLRDKTHNSFESVHHIKHKPQFATLTLQPSPTFTEIKPTRSRKKSSNCSHRCKTEKFPKNQECQSKKTWSQLSQIHKKIKSSNSNILASDKPVYCSKTPQARRFQFKNAQTETSPILYAGSIRLKEMKSPKKMVTTACIQTNKPNRKICYENQRPSLRTARLQTCDGKRKKIVRKVYLKYYLPLYECKKEIGRDGSGSPAVYQRGNISEAGDVHAISYRGSTDSFS